jgi:hypothetical protein
VSQYASPASAGVSAASGIAMAVARIALRRVCEAVERADAMRELC